MKKILLAVVIIVLLASIVLGCAPKAPAPTPTPTPAPSPTPAPTPAPEKLERLIWASFRVGTSLYFADVGLTQLMNQYTDYTSIVQPFPSGVSIYDALHEKKIDLAVQLSSWAYDFAFGIKRVVPVEKHYPEIRGIMGGHTSWWAWVTRADTGIKTIADLKGHTVHYLTPGINLAHIIGGDSLRAAGIDPEKDVKHISFDSNEASAKGLANKQVDAIWVSIQSAYMEEAAAVRPLVVLPFPKEIYDKMSEESKETHIIQELPAGYLPLITQNISAVGWPAIVICRDDLPNDVAYQVVKVTMEHAKEVLTIHPLFREYGKWEYQLPDYFVVPFHPGAIKFFKEAGKWTPAHEARQKKLLDQLKK